MIPTFLHSLAALVASGKALHVTNQTAEELELLAGLTWPAPLPPHVLAQRETEVAWVNRDGTLREHQPPMQPADIAWAWLKLSVAERQWTYDRDGGAEDHGVTNAAQLRAAECAELAAIATALPPRVRNILSSNTVFGPLPMTEPVPQRPHEGTREGARAAWGHIASCTLVHAGDKWDRYRRELEAI